MTPDELKLLRQLEAATSADRPDLADAESAALSDGWRVLQNSLGPVASQPLPSVVSATLAARLTIQSEVAARRRVLLRRAVWATVAVVAIVCSVPFFYAVAFPVQVVEPSRESKLEFSLPPVLKHDPIQTPADGSRSRVPMLVETQPPTAAAQAEGSLPVWDEVDSELTVLSSQVDTLRGEWRLTPSYLDYVARRFEQLEYELAISKL